ncbi:bifunctional folylpolyglutamate synthase/dihydrofolate synthase [bacterium]|nr:bifunctional folylpolyglutamate synthase/dihydrofolate synthase [bacterium]
MPDAPGGGVEPSRRFDFPETPLTAPTTETERFLYSLTRFGMKPGLENIRALAARFGDPQRALRFLHVAGTNGKGSVCHLLERQLRAAGYSTGLFTSPHLLHVGERLRVDGVALGDAGVGALVERVAPAVAEREATFFETITLMGLLHFAERGVDWVLWETGLGGRLDSTRVADAEAALVTGISLDHSRYLGSDLAGIAREKLAIGIAGRPLYSAITSPELRAVAREMAEAIGFELVERDAALAWRLEGGELVVEGGASVAAAGSAAAGSAAAALAGRYPLPGLAAVQAGNAALALLALADLGARRGERLLPADPGAALAATALPARFDRLPGSPLRVIDGGHNPEALRLTLAAWLHLLATEGLPAASACVIFGCMADKEIEPMLALLAECPCRVILTAARQPRAMSPAALAERAGEAAARWEGAADLEAALAAAGPAPALVTGSFYLAGEAYLVLGMA